MKSFSRTQQKETDEKPLPRGGSLLRLRGLVRKEFMQILRDPSALGIAFILPLVLLFLFGYGVSLDSKHIPVGLVVDKSTPDTNSLCGAFERSEYLTPSYFHGICSAEQALMEQRVDVLVHLREDFSEKIRKPEGAVIQVLVNGIDANTARITSGYVEGVYGNWIADRLLESGQHPVTAVHVEQRVWFNANVNSRNYLVPGVIAVIMTLIGALLTALLVAREWERGTMEALLVTPSSMFEILLGKILPYFLLGLLGLALSVVVAIWLFEVPLRGSLGALLVSSSLFLLTALGMGLLISTVTRVQFVAAQVAIITTFLPAFILSGFIFDIGSMPRLIQVITHMIPARYYVEMLKTIFLAGDIWPVLLPNALALMIMMTIFLGLTRRLSQKRLD